MGGSLGVGHEGCKCNNNFGNFGVFCIFGVSVEAFCYNFVNVVVFAQEVGLSTMKGSKHEKACLEKVPAAKTFAE